MPSLGAVIDASLELKPHLAVITGDLISRRGDPLDSCISQLARVKADAGVFGCMGITSVCRGDRLHRGGGGAGGNPVSARAGAGAAVRRPRR